MSITITNSEVSYGNKLIRDSLILFIDTYSMDGFTKFGTSGTNNNYRTLLNLTNYSDSYSLENTSKLSNKIYYTLYGLTYPEGDQTPANRDGITLGFENITSSLTYGASRALNYYVFDEDSEAWVSNSYFNGSRIDGHCYDNYDVASYITETNLFLSDCDTINSNYPNSTHIIIGSHACVRFTESLRNRLMDLGAPSIVGGWTSTTRQEFVLIGKPNLGTGNAYGWTHENITGGANLNVALPINKGGSIIFNGTSDYVTFPGILEGESIGASTHKTIDLWINMSSTGAKMAFSTGQNGNDRIYWWSDDSKNTWRVGDYTSTTGHSTIESNVWYNITLVIDGLNIRAYLNGEEDYSGTYSTFTTRDQATIGRHGDTNLYYFYGEIQIVRVYNKSLSSTEILNNYNNQKTRFGL